MCKHILNAQVAIRAPCCKKWYDCPECHAEQETHPIRRHIEMVFACKKCKKVFRKDLTDYDDSDEYCPHCDNHYVIPADEPQLEVGIETDDPRINNKVLKDDRMKSNQPEYLQQYLQQQQQHQSR